MCLAFMQEGESQRELTHNKESRKRGDSDHEHKCQDGKNKPWYLGGCGSHCRGVQACGEDTSVQKRVCYASQTESAPRARSPDLPYGNENTCYTYHEEEKWNTLKCSPELTGGYSSNTKAERRLQPRTWRRGTGRRIWHRQGEQQKHGLNERRKEGPREGERERQRKNPDLRVPGPGLFMNLNQSKTHSSLGLLPPPQTDLAGSVLEPPSTAVRKPLFMF